DSPPPVRKTPTAIRGTPRYRPANQFGREHWHSIDLTLGPAVFDRHVLALDIAALLEALAERAQVACRRVWRSAVKEPNHRHRGLLRARRERPRRRAGQQRNEIASSYVEHGPSLSRASESP